MAADNQIVIEIVLDDGQILQALGKVKDATKDVKKDIEEPAKKGFLETSLGDITAKTAALGLIAIKTFGAISDGLAKSFKLSVESERAINSFNSTLAASGNFSQEASEKFQGFATELSNLTGMSGEQILETAASFSALTNTSGPALEEATRAAVDLAGATGKSLDTTFNLLTLASSKGVESLEKYGVKVDKSIPKSERFAAAVKQISDRFGSITEARSGNIDVVLLRFGSAIDDIFKAIGNFITKSPAFLVVMQEITKLVQQFAARIDALRDGGNPFDTFIKAALTTAVIINHTLIAPLEMFFNLLAVGARTVGVVFFGAIVGVLNTAATLIDNLLLTPLKTIFTVMADVLSVFNKEAGEKAQALVDNISGVVKDGLDSVTEGSREAFTDQFAKLGEAAGSAFETPIALAANNVLTNLEDAAHNADNLLTKLNNSNNKNQDETVAKIETVSQGFSAVMDGMGAASDQFVAKSTENFQAIGASMFQSIGQGAGQAFAAFGKAIAKGENGLEAFANALLATMGQMAIQLGTQFILLGLVYTWAGMANGPPLILAGAALAAFGGILSSVGSGGASASSPTDATQPTDELGDIDATGPQDTITVNIAGDILDSQDTGSRIINLLSEYADKNGSGVTVS